VAEQFSCTPYNDYMQMLDKEDLDAISICTPPVTHAGIMLNALPRVHVLCEKPLTIDLSDAKKVLAVVEQHDTRTLMMASKFRFVDDVVNAKSLVESGILGKVILFENVFCSRVDMRDRWNSRKSIAGGGVLFDNGTHSVDIARFLVGPIATVQAQLGIQIQAMEVEDTCRLYFQGVTGVQGTIDLSWSIHKDNDAFISIFGTEGTLQIGWRQSRYRQSEKVDWVVFGDGYNKQKAFGNQLRHFLACASGQQTPIITPLDALESVRVIEAAYRSSAINKWMELEPLTSGVVNVV
jgi:predicted dehydrogenase